MFTFKFLLVVILVLCVLLVLIVLAQNPKGGGLSSAIGGGSGSQMFGVQQTNNFLVNTTWGLAIAIAFLVLFSGFLIEKPEQQIMAPEIENIDFGGEGNSAPAETPAAPSTDVPVTPDRPAPAPATPPAGE